jgi:hypothetical protein
VQNSENFDPQKTRTTLRSKDSKARSSAAEEDEWPSHRKTEDDASTFFVVIKFIITVSFFDKA